MSVFSSRLPKRRQSVLARQRLLMAGAFGLLVGGAAAIGTGQVGLSILAAWDVAVAVYVGWMLSTLWPMSADHTATWAGREDPGRTTTDLLLVLASVASLGAVGLVIAAAASTSGPGKVLLIGFGVLSVVVSWSLIHTVYALAYAKLYYLGRAGGIDFGQSKPRYSDFLYLAFTIGMTFQVSDTTITSPNIRRALLQHALLSYLFGTVIVATTINLVAGLGK